MAIYFFDSSALAKKHIAETGTVWVRRLFNDVPPHEIYVSRLTEVEVAAALARRKKGGSLSAGNAALALQQLRNDFLTRYRILEINSLVTAQAITLTEIYALRGYDAMQLASALRIRNRLLALGVNLTVLPFTLVSADDELNTAALAENLSVENPNYYP